MAGREGVFERIQRTSAARGARKKANDDLARRHGTFTTAAARRHEALQDASRAATPGHQRMAASTVVGRLTQDKNAMRHMASLSALLPEEPRRRSSPREVVWFCRRMGIQDAIGRAYWRQAKSIVGGAAARDRDLAAIIEKEKTRSLLVLRVAVSMLVVTKYPYLLLPAAPRDPDYRGADDRDLVMWLSRFVRLNR